jgi:hypothetical protein
MVEVTGEIPNAIETDIVQTYLMSEPGTVVRLRKRMMNGKYVYLQTTTKTVSENERIETPDMRKPAEPENIFEAALAAARNQNAVPVGQFTGPSTFDPDFIRTQLMKEQPDEYFCGGVTADGDSDPLGLYKTANERADGIVRSVMA